jgi:hypothetical protein
MDCPATSLPWFLSCLSSADPCTGLFVGLPQKVLWSATSPLQGLLLLGVRQRGRVTSHLCPGGWREPLTTPIHLSHRGREKLGSACLGRFLTSTLQVKVYVSLTSNTVDSGEMVAIQLLPGLPKILQLPLVSLGGWFHTPQPYQNSRMFKSLIQSGIVFTLVAQLE